MRWARTAAKLAALAGIAPRQGADSTLYLDPVSGISFASYTNDHNIIFRIAVPDTTWNKTYDSIVQILSPVSMGWAGLAWGGSMTYNPLTIAWANGTSNAVVSSREAFGYYVPPEYNDATYTVLKKISFVNATHWQITAKCTGCTKWGDDTTGIQTLEQKGQNQIAFAWSSVPVDKPADNSSSFGIHDSIGHPIFDFSVAANKNFDALVTKNL